ncbi:DUF4328 domain-containing protein [Kribbella sp. CA-293567]|uniref:DUF4328 domain-containing protein n=1 Tax=Kribbella sp. CA-293567 TaxID=3002436 RepID=UPI0022DDCA77|nr:DUF4328 domain-containing protein [Kribbella sp. CA-293567]WBQ05475.1 DUF4328 domain-containing protein [Kribbella sp. CA-293567]
MSQHYPGPPGYFPAPHPGVPPMVPRTYQSLRRITVVFGILMALTTIVTGVQAALMWRSYDEVKRFVFGLLSDDELDRAVQSVAGSGPLLNVVGLLFLGTTIVFLIWLWRARENTEVLTPAAGGFQGGYQGAQHGGQRGRGGPHRHEQGWVIGAWVCPIVQFWYPLQVVEDVVRASEPTEAPGPHRTAGWTQRGQVRTLLYGWWTAWTTFWVIIVGGGSVAMFSVLVWIVRVVERAEAADASGDYLDLYDLQTFMVRLALAVNIGFTVAAVALVVAGATIVLLMIRTNSWQDGRMAARFSQPPSGPPQYVPRPAFPSYTQRSPWQR